MEIGEATPTTEERRAPAQGDGWKPRGEVGREPGTITWAEHEEIWKAYAKKYPLSTREQDAERLAARGGFGYDEIVSLVGHAPTTWRPRPRGGDLVKRRRTSIPPPDKDGLARTALHEAGHAVMALVLGCRVEHAIVRLDGDGCVNVWHGRGRRDPFVTALIAWAGSVAEGQAGIQEGDLAPMRRAGLRPASRGTIRQFVERTFRTPSIQAAIEAVATLLLGRLGRRVPGAEVRAAAVVVAPWIAEVPAIDAPRCWYCTGLIGAEGPAAKCQDRKTGPCVSRRRGRTA